MTEFPDSSGQATATSGRAVSDDDMLTDLTRLEREEARISAVRRRVHDQIDLGFPNESIRAYERQLSDRRRELHSRIDYLRASVLPDARRR